MGHHGGGIHGVLIAGGSAVGHNVVPDEVHALQFPGAGRKDGRGKVGKSILRGGHRRFQKGLAESDCGFFLLIDPGAGVVMGSAHKDLLPGNAGGGGDSLPDPFVHGDACRQQVGGIQKKGLVPFVDGDTGQANVVNDLLGAADLVITVAGEVGGIVGRNDLSGIAGGKVQGLVHSGQLLPVV